MTYLCPATDFVPGKDMDLAPIEEAYASFLVNSFATVGHTVEHDVDFLRSGHHGTTSHKNKTFHYNTYD